MITGLTEEQFKHLPSRTLFTICDQCGKERDYGYLIRDINDYSLVDGVVTKKPTYTALYLCGICQWKMQCAFKPYGEALEREDEE